MNFANKISTFRILSVPFFIASIIYYCHYPEKGYLRVIALVIFILAVISDAVDGYIARKSQQMSKAGLILDPLGDKLLLMSAFVCLYFLPTGISFPLWVTLIVVSRDAVILLGVLIIFIVRQNMNIMPTKWGKLTTTFQMLAAFTVLAQWRIAYFVMYVAVAFTLISGIDYIMRGFKVLYAPDNSRIIISYLIGSIPTAYIFGRLLKGIDIRKFGSGNVGATNVLRVLGRAPAIIVLLLDIFKGFLAVVFVADFIALGCQSIPPETLRIILGFSCIAGHNWTVFLGLKGGKGVASTLGVLLGLAVRIAGFNLVFGLVILTWLVVFIPSRIVSLASVVSGLSIPIYMVLFRQSRTMVIAGVAIAVFIILRHKANIRRMLQGKEPRTAFKKPAS